MKTCRGIGVSLTEQEMISWEREHIRLLAEIAPEEFTILHYGAMAELRVIKQALLSVFHASFSCRMPFWIKGLKGAL